MFFRPVLKEYRDRTYQYLQLVESYRDGKRTRQRVLHSFGNVADLSDPQRQSLLCSLRRALGLDVTGPNPDRLSEPRLRHLLSVNMITTGGNLPRSATISAARLPRKLKQADRETGAHDEDSQTRRAR